MTIPKIQFNKTMSLPFTVLIAFRYVTLHNRSPGSSFLTWVSLLGLMLSVATLIVVISVMNGFERELQNRLLSLIPDAKVHINPALDGSIDQRSTVNWQTLRQELLMHSNITAAAPFIAETAMVNVDGRFQVVELLGLDYALEKTVTGINDFIIAGNVATLEDTKYGILIGRLLARKMGLSVGDKVQISLPKIAISPAGIVMREKRFTVAAIFEVGAELDQNLVIINLLTSQKLSVKGASVDGLRLSVANKYNIQQDLDNTLHQLASQNFAYSHLSAIDWRQEQSSLFTAIAMEKIIIFVLLLAVVAVAAFNIISIVLMSVMDKYSDIAVLKTMGATSHEIRNIFILQGLFIASIGTLLGTVLGLVIAPNVGSIVATLEHMFNWQLFDPSVFYIAHLPSETAWQDVAITVFSAMVISFFASIYPAHKAASVPPAAALSYEF